jgi:hypothetical protein
MSIFDNVYYAETRTVDHEPAWSKAERYSYCEPAELSAAGVFSKVWGSIKTAFSK